MLCSFLYVFLSYIPINTTTTTTTNNHTRPNSWSHRKWISKQLLQMSHGNGNGNTYRFNTSPVRQEQQLSPSLSSITEWTKNELEICTSIAEKYPKNYYAWTHRRFVIDTILQIQIQLGIQTKMNPNDGTPPTNKNIAQENDTNNTSYDTLKDYTWNLLQSEFSMIHSTWITKHVSDHSAVHYGGEILQIMILLKLPSHIFALDGDKKNNHHDNDDYRKLSKYNFIRHYSYYCECCNYNDNDEENQRWIMDTLQNTLCQSQELITKHPTNEVIWIWRRVCSQIYMHYMALQGTLTTDIRGNNHCGDSQNNDAITNTDTEEFVHNEIKTLSTAINDDNIMILKDEYDQRLNKLNCTTYILWLLEHIRRQVKRTKNTLTISDEHGIDYSNESERTKLEVKLIHSLGSYQGEGINGSTLSFSNIWSMKRS